MRNLKKILALVLALVMSMSLMATAGAFEDKADIDPTFNEAITVLSNLKVFQGYDDGKTFQPKGAITRAEVAAIIYRIATGDVADKQVGIYSDYKQFDDVKSTAWYAGYVNYCANAKLIKGYDANTFGPNDPVTGYQALAMILRAVGYDKNGEFTGTRWTVETAAVGKQLHITDNVTANTLNSNATREVVAEILFKAIMVPQVTYTPALGYQSIGLSTNNNIWDGWFVDNASIGAETFGLAKTEGEITAVGRAAGTTTLGNWRSNIFYDEFVPNEVVITNTNTSWENIGYAAYAYTVPTAGAKTRTAVSDVTVTGTSLAVNTAATSDMTIKPLVGGATKIADLDAPYNVYFNGMLLGTTQDANGYWFDASTMVVKYGANAVDVVNGLKVDFVDNDNGGKVEAIVFTEYTAGQIVGIATDSNTGVNAYVPNTYYFDVWSKTEGTANHYSKVDNTVCADTLANGDVVTYVVYNGDTYVTKAPVAVGTFTQINYNVVGASRPGMSYVIGDQTYYLANNEDTEVGYVQDYFYADLSLLAQTAVKKSLAVYTDPHGYLFYVTEDMPAANYLFLVWNEDTDVRPGTTGITAVNPDGSVVEMDIANVIDANDPANTGWNWNRNQIKQHIYNNNSGVLTESCTGEYTGNYTKGSTKLTNGAYFTASSVVVDIRGVLNRTATAGTVYTYDKVPSLNGATVHYVADARGFITLAYITDGVETDSKDFIVYHTEINNYGVVNGKPLYSLQVLQDGALTTITLNQDQYDAIVTYGVGIYSFDRLGRLDEYTSFAEEWYDVRWSDNTIVLAKNGQDVASYRYNDAKFYVLDIEKNKAEGAVYGYNMVYGQDVQAYVVTSSGSAAEIYIIKGAAADATTDGVKTTSRIKDNQTYTYYVKAGMVTGYTTQAFATAAPTVYLLDQAGNKVEPEVKADSNGVLTLTYGQYVQYAKDGKINVQVVPADGNKVAVDSNPDFSVVGTSQTASVKISEAGQNFYVKSVGTVNAFDVQNYKFTAKFVNAKDDATLKISDATTFPNARLGSEKIGFIGNAKVEYSVLKQVFVPNDVNATAVWSYTDGTGRTLTGDDIPADADTAAGTWKVTVTAENGTTTKTYTLNAVYAISAKIGETLANDQAKYKVDSVNAEYAFDGESVNVKVQVSREGTFIHDSYGNSTYKLNNGSAVTTTVAASGSTASFTAQITSIAADTEISLETIAQTVI